MNDKNTFSEITWFLLFLVVMLSYSFGQYVERKSIFKTVSEGRVRVGNGVYQCKWIKTIRGELNGA